MPVITLKTKINAPAVRCFDLSRSIDLHKLSTQHTEEEAVEGKTSGLIGPGEYVVWKARHFGVMQRLSTKITGYERPYFFADEMIKGAFKCFRHEHHFKESGGVTLMTDYFDYTSPLGLLGRLADVLFLKKYMTELLIKRNQAIKAFAESERWREVLEE